MYNEPPTPPIRNERDATITLADVVESIGDHWVRYLLLGVVAIIAVNVVAVVRQPDEPLYHAEALVVATTLEIRVDSFPRTAAAIFNGGSVARLAATASGTGIDPDDLVPEIVSVDPVENTTVVEVDALHPDPELAALYANVAGQALADEMNRIGPGLGTFELGFEATPPREPENQSIIPFIVLSPVAALFLVVGTAVLVTFIRLQAARLLGGPSEPQAPTRNRSPIWSMQDDTSGGSSAAVPPTSAGLRSEAAEPIATDVEDHDTPDDPITSGSDEQREGKGIDISIDEFTDFRWHERHEDRELAPEPEPFLKPLERIERPSPVHPLSPTQSQAQELIDLVNGIGPVYGSRLAVLGITKLHQLAAANPRWIASAVEVPEEMVIDWIRQAIGFTGKRKRRQSGD